MRARAVAWLALVAMLEAGCKAPRSPREVSLGSLTGEWTAESISGTTPEDTTRSTWLFSLLEREAGKLRGQGSVARGTAREEFAVSGVRGETRLDLQFELGGESVRYHGSVMGPRTIVGEIYLPRDTIPVSLVRPPADRP